MENLGAERFKSSAPQFDAVHAKSSVHPIIRSVILSETFATEQKD